MATFKPFGFQGAYSTSAASIAKPTLLSFPWNPIFSGWSGDLAVQYLPLTPTTLATDGGYVYPAPINLDGLTPVPDFRFNYPPIVGVIVGFKYTPKNNSILPNDIWSSYAAGTEVLGNIEVIIDTDAQARYQIQYNGTNKTPKGVPQEALFGAGTLGAGETYTQVVSGITFTFAKGYANSSTSTASGQIPGTSSMCMDTFVNQADLLGDANYAVTKSTAYPLFIQTQNNYNGTSGWYVTGETENENTIVTVMINPSMMITTSYPILEQKPATS